MAGNGKERTEEQKITHGPEAVVLGGRTYHIKPLTINEQYEWRQQVYEVLREVIGSVSQDTFSARLFSWLPGYGGTRQFTRAVQMAFLGFPKRAADLFFAYARDLPRKEIEERATEQELVQAALVVWRLGYPFFDVLRAALGKMPGSQLASVLSTSTPSRSGAARPSTSTATGQKSS